MAIYDWHDGEYAVDERFDEIMQEVAAVCKKVEPDCKIMMQLLSVTVDGSEQLRLQ